jgi:hypothetical protein
MDTIFFFSQSILVISKKSLSVRESKDPPAAAAIQFFRLPSVTCWAWLMPGSRMNSAKMSVKKLFMNISSLILYGLEYHNPFPCATS